MSIPVKKFRGRDINPTNHLAWIQKVLDGPAPELKFDESLVRAAQQACTTLPKLQTSKSPFVGPIKRWLAGQKFINATDMYLHMDGACRAAMVGDWAAARVLHELVLLLCVQGRFDDPVEWLSKATPANMNLLEEWITKSES